MDSVYEIANYLDVIGCTSMAYLLNNVFNYKLTNVVTILVPSDSAFNRLSVKTNRNLRELLRMPEIVDLISNHISYSKLQDFPPMLTGINGRVWGTKLSDLSSFEPRETVLQAGVELILIEKMLFFNDQLEKLISAQTLSEQTISAQIPSEQIIEGKSLIFRDREDPTEAYQNSKRQLMTNYFNGLRCPSDIVSSQIVSSRSNPPFMNLILKNGSTLTFTQIMNFDIKGVAIGQYNGTYFVLKFINELEDANMRARPNDMIEAHNKAHIIANNGSMNFFSDVYAIIQCNVQPAYEVPDIFGNMGKVIGQSIFIYEAGNINFAEWYTKISAKQFHQVVQQWLLSFIIQALLGYAHGDPTEANITVLYLNFGGQWKYNIGNDTSLYMQNGGFLLKMIDYDESDPNSDPLESIKRLPLIFGQTYPHLENNRNEVLPETKTFMNSVALLENVTSISSVPDILKRMPILADLFTASNAPILGDYHISI